MKVILDNEEIETSHSRIASARHSCVFSGLSNRWMQAIHIDDKGHIRCSHCGQRPHETSIPALRTLLCD